MGLHLLLTENNSISHCSLIPNWEQVKVWFLEYVILDSVPFEQMYVLLCFINEVRFS
jgi:hypothetical protein